MNDVVIRRAAPRDVPFLADLQNQLTYAVGKIPKGALVERLYPRRSLPPRRRGAGQGRFNGLDDRCRQGAAARDWRRRTNTTTLDDRA